MTTLRFTRETFIAAFLIVLLFASGVGVGFGLARVFGAHHQKGPVGHRGSPATRAMDALALNAEQTRAVDAAFEKARRKAEAAHQKLRPELDAVFESAKVEVRAVLNDEQRALFDEMAITPPPPPGGPHGGPPHRVGHPDRPPPHPHGPPHAGPPPPPTGAR